MASLLTIPLELLVAISAYLPTQDLGSLRLACKQTEKSLYEWFSKEFFSKKQFMLTHTSLQALVDISKHVGLSKKLTHVIIATNVFEEMPLRFRDEDSAACYIQGYEDQKALLNTGVDREMLTEAFQRLENLQTIGIRDFDSHSRVRDGRSWTSWGATTVYRETGIRLNVSDRNQARYAPEVSSRFASRVFSSILYSLGKANRQPPEFEHVISNNEAFLRWLSEPASVAALQSAAFLNPVPIALPRLKNLELGQLSVRPGVLHSVVSKFAPTLQDLSLWRINLQSITPVPSGHKPNFWKDLFNQLSKIPQLNINRLKVGMLQQDHMFVNFKEDEEGSKPSKEKEYSGKDMYKFWVQLKEQVSVEWPPEPVFASDDGSDEDEDMDDEDEHLDSEDEEDDEDDDE
ncbi:f-box-like protein [Stemphylium lycopersici]|uniref:F-box-like protein n=1 Tax=Stemphylium lycopersici TaxID=183478 RepID=A0A364N4F1_STELY|nr:f-box-like protein [Stemphylium lycopersici]